MTTNILIEVSREQQVQIEEYCTNEGIKISDYFIKLHNAFSESLPTQPKELEPWVEKMQSEKSEKKAEVTQRYLQRIKKK